MILRTIILFFGLIAVLQAESVAEKVSVRATLIDSTVVDTIQKSPINTLNDVKNDSVKSDTLVTADPALDTLKKDSMQIESKKDLGKFKRDSVNKNFDEQPVEEQSVYTMSGIPAVDTLKSFEWDIPTNNKNMFIGMGLGLLFPGGTHYYTGHYVRGGFITTITLGLFYDVLISKNDQFKKQNKTIHEIKNEIARLDTLILTEPGGSDFDGNKAKRYIKIRELRKENDDRVKRQDLQNCEMAWAVGMYVYNVMDGYGIMKHNQGRDLRKRDPYTAAWKAALLPGWGQIYNEEYGKAGLLYMAYLGSYVSYNSSQSVVEYYLKRLQTARIEGDGLDATTDIETQLTNERKSRNKYIWGPILLYAYSIADAVVDAILSDFDSPINLSLAPSREPRNVAYPEIVVTFEF